MNNNYFKIGEIEIKNRVILAPMAGITSFSYRKFISHYFNGLKYTEMVSDSGLYYNSEETKRIIYSDGSEYPLALQLFGSDKNKMLEAIDRLEQLNAQYDILDINLACPVTKVVKTGAGSALLNDQEYLFDLMSAIVQKSKKPVTAKVRLGYKSINIFETLKTLEKAGVKFVAIHARTKEQLYSGVPQFDVLKDVKKIINIPFGISGNIFTVQDALSALEITKADAVLVARGVIGNPKLIMNIEKALNNEPYDESVNISQQIEHLKEFANLLIEEKGEKSAISILRGIAPKFFFALPNSREIRNKLAQNMKSYKDLIDILSTIQIDQ